MKTKLSQKKREQMAEQLEDFAYAIKEAGRILSNDFCKDLNKIAKSIRENTINEYPEIETLVDGFYDDLREEIECSGLYELHAIIPRKSLAELMQGSEVDSD